MLYLISDLRIYSQWAEMEKPYKLYYCSFMYEADTVRVFVDFCGTMIKQLHTHVVNH